MIFVLSKLGWALVRPGNLLAMVLVLGRLLQISRRPAVCRLGKSLVSGCVLLVAALTLLPVGQLTLRPLEERFPQPELPARIDGIILLGGSVHTEMTADRGSRYSTVPPRELRSSWHWPAATRKPGWSSPADRASCSPATCERPT